MVELFRRSSIFGSDRRLPVAETTHVSGPGGETAESGRAVETRWAVEARSAVETRPAGEAAKTV